MRLLVSRRVLEGDEEVARQGKVQATETTTNNLSARTSPGMAVPTCTQCFFKNFRQRNRPQDSQAHDELFGAHSGKLVSERVKWTTLARIKSHRHSVPGQKIL